LSQIHAALAYYYDHPEEINEEMRESEELVESLKREYVKKTDCRGGAERC